MYRNKLRNHNRNEGIVTDFLESINPFSAKKTDEAKQVE